MKDVLVWYDPSTNMLPYNWGWAKVPGDHAYDKSLELLHSWHILANINVPFLFLYHVTHIAQGLKQQHFKRNPICAGFHAAHQVVKASLFMVDKGHNVAPSNSHAPFCQLSPHQGRDGFSHIAAEAARQFGAACSEETLQQTSAAFPLSCWYLVSEASRLRERRRTWV